MCENQRRHCLQYFCITRNNRLTHFYLKFSGNVNSSLDLKEDEWNKVVTTNLKGTWLVSKAVGKRMHEAKQYGSIINISSIGSLSSIFVDSNVLNSVTDSVGL